MILVLPKHPQRLYMDNQSAIQISCTSLIAHSNHTKHIDTRHHWICEQVRNNIVDPQYIPTIDQTADILTKALPKAKVEKFRDDFCLVSTRSG